MYVNGIPPHSTTDPTATLYTNLVSFYSVTGPAADSITETYDWATHNWTIFTDNLWARKLIASFVGL